MSFIPKDYKVPTTSQYLSPSKLPQGQTLIRILSSAIIGYEYWNNNNKPIRNKKGWAKPPEDIRIREDGSYEIKHFWAFVIWNYSDESIRIMEITQKSIMTDIKTLADNSEWGDPLSFNITIHKEGTGLKTKYKVLPSPKSEVSEEILQAYEKKPINLEALFSGLNPFDDKDAVPDNVPEQVHQVVEDGVEEINEDDLANIEASIK